MRQGTIIAVYWQQCDNDANFIYILAFQSSDYRTEDGYSRSDDYDHSDRKYRSQVEYRKDYRERERRSRSRSRSCDRDDRNYEHYEAENNYSRHEDRERQKEKKEVPNKTLMLRGLPLHYSEKDVQLILLV